MSASRRLFVRRDPRPASTGWGRSHAGAAFFTVALTTAISSCSSDDGTGGATPNSGGALAQGGAAGTSGLGASEAGGAPEFSVGGASAGAFGAGGAAGSAPSTGGAGGAVVGSGGTGYAGAAAAGAAGSLPPGEGDSSAAVADLEKFLQTPRAQRGDVAGEPFAAVPLTRQDAEHAAELIWTDFADGVRESRSGEMGATESRAASFQVAGSTLKYYQAERGSDPPGGRSLFISMHGGGNAPAATNDQQWENQITLVDGYNPRDAIWVAPRAPSNEWNMWFTRDVDALFEHLITNMIVFEGVDPNKVYLNGYSAGGDGVYQLGPRMADCWAGAGMSAGHPNDATPDNLRNVAFAIHVGGNDTAYDRNLKAGEWGAALEALAMADGNGGYVNQWQVHAGLPHWMNLADAVSIPFLQMHTRNPVPSKVVWHQKELAHARSYWLAVEGDDQKVGTEVTAAYSGNTIEISEVSGLGHLKVRVSDSMMDLDEPVRVVSDENELHSGPIPRTIAIIDLTTRERGDPELVYFGEVEVALP